MTHNNQWKSELSQSAVLEPDNQQGWAHERADQLAPHEWHTIPRGLDVVDPMLAVICSAILANHKYKQSLVFGGYEHASTSLDGCPDNDFKQPLPVDIRCLFIDQETADPGSPVAAIDDETDYHPLPLPGRIGDHLS